MKLTKSEKMKTITEITIFGVVIAKTLTVVTVYMLL